MSEPNPYAEDDRIRALPPAIQKRMLRLTVWCEAGRCAVIRAFEVPRGILIRCSSEANIAHMRARANVVADGDWSRRRAFFMEDRLRDEKLTLICDCNHTQERVVAIGRLADLIGTKPNASIGALLAP